MDWPEGEKTNRKKKSEAISISWTWRAKRHIKRRLCTSSYTERLGTITPGQVAWQKGWRGKNETEDRVAWLYRAHWDMLRPGSFRTIKSEHDHTIQAEHKVTILIPVQVVRDFTTGQIASKKERVIQKAIRALSKNGQPVNVHTINALLALYDEKTSRQYAHSILKAAGFAKAYSVAKVPYWTPKETASA